MVIATYLLINSAFLWILKGQFNLLDSGWAHLDNLFILSPWIFMFLLPAITMRMFSEEKRNGTLELLFTQPLSEWTIVLAKFLAAFLLVGLALMPTLLYFYTLYELGAPAASWTLAAAGGATSVFCFWAAPVCSHRPLGVQPDGQPHHRLLVGRPHLFCLLLWLWRTHGPYPRR